MQWVYGLTEIIDYTKENNLKLGFVNISEWERNMTQGIVDAVKTSIPETKQTLIPNPIMDDIINEVLESNPVRKSHKFIFPLKMVSQELFFKNGVAYMGMTTIASSPIFFWYFGSAPTTSPKPPAFAIG